MKTWRLCGLMVAMLASIGCGGPEGGAGAGGAKGVAVKPPVEDLIFGIYERHPPEGTTAMKLNRDGSLVVAHDRGALDSDKTIATGSWQLQKDTLTLSYSMGACADAHTGTYKVNVTKLGIHFTKLDDACPERGKIDGETWRRYRPNASE